MALGGLIKLALVGAAAYVGVKVATAKSSDDGRKIPSTDPDAPLPDPEIPSKKVDFAPPNWTGYAGGRKLQVTKVGARWRWSVDGSGTGKELSALRALNAAITRALSTAPPQAGVTLLPRKRTGGAPTADMLGGEVHYVDPSEATDAAKPWAWRVGDNENAADAMAQGAEASRVLAIGTLLQWLKPITEGHALS